MILTNKTTKTSYYGVVAPGQGDLSLGHHCVVCDMKTSVSSLPWSSNFALMIGYDAPKYCVIDLSAGATASSYPVYYLFSEPTGGWTDEYKTSKLVLRYIAAGSFKMQQYKTTKLTRPFYIGVFELTAEQWRRVMGDGMTGDSTKPVTKCSYDMIRGSTNGAKWPNSSTVDGTSFMGVLQSRTGLKLDLPTEAQWEYACRAGTTTTYYWGDSLSKTYACFGVSAPCAVGTRLPNNWGLYDMSGNVWELCLDWNGTLAYGTDPKGAISGDCRVLRGDSYTSNSSPCCTSSVRSYSLPSAKYSDVGFRISWTIP